MTRRLGSVLGALLCLLAAVAAPVTLAHSAEGDGGALQSDGALVTFETPAPGHTVEVPLHVRNTGGHTLDLSLALREATGAATEGPHPLRLAVHADDGGLLVGGTADELLDQHVALAALPAGAERTLRATAHLPAGAGDDYRGAPVSLRFTFTGTGDPGGVDSGGLPDGSLAITGARGLWILAVALPLMIVGILLLPARRKREKEAEDHEPHA
ncbi:MULTISPECIES: hypothetical protein [Arthrobacter]|uniref:Uncharacterized protein n=2 Tax=Arthrobacter TaxID=1663 RepID=A0ABU9KNX6_9MICC|nr:hypothetical protein [Arthrobacter sp. YJM1]MDP5228624.1 hypothetical protein [Arthrobacter sp. YJM1]